MCVHDGTMLNCPHCDRFGYEYIGSSEINDDCNETKSI